MTLRINRAPPGDSLALWREISPTPLPAYLPARYRRREAFRGSGEKCVTVPARGSTITSHSVASYQPQARLVPSYSGLPSHSMWSHYQPGCGQLPARGSTSTELFWASITLCPPRLGGLADLVALRGGHSTSHRLDHYQPQCGGLHTPDGHTTSHSVVSYQPGARLVPATVWWTSHSRWSQYRAILVLVHTLAPGVPRGSQWAPHPGAWVTLTTTPRRPDRRTQSGSIRVRSTSYGTQRQNGN